jgi:hypothetical protein
MMTTVQCPNPACGMVGTIDPAHLSGPIRCPSCGLQFQAYPGQVAYRPSPARGGWGRAILGLTGMGLALAVGAVLAMRALPGQTSSPQAGLQPDRGPLVRQDAPRPALPEGRGSNEPTVRKEAPSRDESNRKAAEAAEAKRRQADAAKKAEEEGLEKERRGPDRDRIVEDEEEGRGDAVRNVEEEGLEVERRGLDRDRIVEDEEGGDGDGEDDETEEGGLEMERRGLDRDRIVEDEEGGDGDGDEAEDDEDGQELPFPGGG